MAAIAVWRLYPTQIESGLSLFYHRNIDEWLADDPSMSSRELLGLIEGLPEDSDFKKARDRTFRVAERDGKLMLYPAVVIDTDGITHPVELPADAELITQFVDWTHDRKIAARNARETAALRMELRHAGQGYDVDFSGLTEPLHQIVADRQQQAVAENHRGAKSAVRRGLFAKVKEGR